MKSKFRGSDISFRNQGGGISLPEIQAIERQLGLQFPDSLRDYYVAFNGGNLEYDCFPWGRSYLKVADFLRLNSNNKNVGFEETCTDLLRENPYWPKHLVPFATDDGGDYFCYSCRSEDFGAIYFHCSEFSGDPEREMSFLASDFATFILALKSEAVFLQP